MRILTCRRCHGTIEYTRDTGSGRLPCYCKPCVKLIEVERIQARNAADRARRRAERDPLCRDCRLPLVFDDSGPRRDMHTYCAPCRTMRKRSQDSRRVDAKPRSAETDQREVTA
jgi:hypothetical protein